MNEPLKNGDRVFVDMNNGIRQIGTIVTIPRYSPNSRRPVTEGCERVLIDGNSNISTYHRKFLHLASDRGIK